MMFWYAISALAIAAGFASLSPTPAVALNNHDSIPATYPQSLERDLKILLDAARSGRQDSDLLARLAEVYLDLGDDLYDDEKKRHHAYEEGSRAARRALEIDDRNADAHFLFAANLGSATRLKGLPSAAWTLKDIKNHLERAIELRPDHAPALQMMGGLLAELPWLVGGDSRAAQRYLERAIAVDANYTNARLLLAKLYVKQNRLDEARQELEAVIRTADPHYRYAWANKFKPEAERLLKTLQEKSDRERRRRPG